MTNLMLALYEFTSARRMGCLMEDPNYANFSRCAGLQEQSLRERLDGQSAQHLDRMLAELDSQHSAELEAMFRAAFSLSRELNSLLRP